MDTDGRWTIKRGRPRPLATGEPQAHVAPPIAVPVFGYKNHLGIDRRYGFIRRFAVTDAAMHDGHQLGRLLDPDNTASAVWADSAYRSAANVALLARRGLVPPFQRPKRRGQPKPRQLARGNASRARVRASPWSTSLPPRNAALASSSARSASPAPPLGSGSPTWSPTCAA